MDDIPLLSPNIVVLFLLFFSLIELCLYNIFHVVFLLLFCHLHSDQQDPTLIFEIRNLNVSLNDI